MKKNAPKPHNLGPQIHTIRHQNINGHCYVEIIFHQTTPQPSPTEPIILALRTISTNDSLDFERHIRQSLFRHVSLATLAAECNMSLSGFKTRFRQHFGESPHRWFLRERLDAARTLLITTNEPIKRVAHECGFASASHLIRHFSKTFGTTPAHYRSNPTLPQATLTNTTDGTPTLPQATLNSTAPVVSNTLGAEEGNY